MICYLGWQGLQISRKNERKNNRQEKIISVVKSSRREKKYFCKWLSSKEAVLLVNLWFWSKVKIDLKKKRECEREKRIGMRISAVLYNVFLVKTCFGKIWKSNSKLKHIKTSKNLKVSNQVLNMAKKQHWTINLNL